MTKYPKYVSKFKENIEAWHIIQRNLKNKMFNYGSEIKLYVKSHSLSNKLENCSLCTLISKKKKKKLFILYSIYSCTAVQKFLKSVNKW